MQSEKPTIFQAERSPLKVTLLVFSGSSIMCVASTVDPLRAANRVSGEVVFDWKIVSVDGDPPVTTSGLPVAVSGRFDPAEATDVLILVGGFGTRDQASRELLAGVRRVAKAARACGGVEAGPGCSGGRVCSKAGRRRRIGRTWRTSRPPFRERMCGRTDMSSTDRSSHRAGHRRPST